MHRRTVATFAALFAIVGGLAPQVAAAPPNIANRPTKSESDIQSAVERVENLSEQATETRDALNKAQMELADTYDKVTSAQRKARKAKAAAESVRERVHTTHRRAEAAQDRLRKAREEVDELTAESMQLGNLESARALFGADDIDDVLTRKSLLNVISESRADALRDLRRASSREAEDDSAAQAALRKSVDKRETAQRAVQSAKQAFEDARSGEGTAKQRAEKLVERQQDLQRRLSQARDTLTALREQREETDQADKGADRPTLSDTARAATTQAAGGDVVAPTTGTVTSTYGPRGGTIHYGLDIANSTGTPVVSVVDGKVISSGPASGFGRWVRVQHDNGIVTVYGHIHESMVSVGDQVSAGQQIATIGNRGESTGPHLHFGVQRSGSKINPLTWLHAHNVSI